MRDQETQDPVNSETSVLLYEIFAKKQFGFKFIVESMIIRTHI